MPHQYYTVFVESDIDLPPNPHLEAAGFPPSVCKGLLALGFQHPTPVQARGWPYVSRGNTLLIAPPSSGKTLAYLLPLLTKKEGALNGSVAPSVSPTQQPRVVVLVASSWQARVVMARSRQILSWLCASKRFK